MDIKANKDLQDFQIPNTFLEYRQLLYSVLKAIKNEPTLCVENRTLYDDLMDCGSRFISAFFGDHNIEDKPDSYSILIASDKDGNLITMGKDDDGQYIEIKMDINSREKYVRFGVTNLIDGHRYNFYKTLDCFIDYHHSSNGNGYARRMRTRSIGGWNTLYCDENGHSDIITNAKGIWGELKSIFKKD